MRSSACRCPRVASLSHATVIRLGQVVGATHVVIGSFAVDGQHDVGARAEHPARHRTDGARVRRSGPARRSVCDFRARQPAPRRSSRLRHADHRSPRCPCSRTTSKGSSRRRRQRRSVISKRPSSSIRASIARASRSGTCTMTTGTDRRRWWRPRPFPRRRRCTRARRFSVGAVAHPAESPRRCVCHAAARWPIARPRRR